MKASVVISGILFVCLTLRKRCLSTKSLRLQENDTCQKLFSDRCRVKCTPFLSYHYYDDCSNWCREFAKCFNETGNQPWVDHCSLQFRQKMSPFREVVRSYRGSSFATRIHVRPCSLHVFVFRAWRCNCSVEDNENGTDSCLNNNNINNNNDKEGVCSNDGDHGDKDNNKEKKEERNETKNKNCIKCRKITNNTRICHFRYMTKSETRNRNKYLKNYLRKEKNCPRLGRFYFRIGNMPCSTCFVDGCKASKDIFKIRGGFCHQSPGSNCSKGTSCFKVTECSCQRDLRERDENGSDDEGQVPFFKKTAEKFSTSLYNMDLLTGPTPQVINASVSMIASTTQEFKSGFLNDTHINTTDEERKESIIFTMLAFEDFFIRLAEENLNASNPNVTYKGDQLEFRIQRDFMQQQNEIDFLLNETKGNCIKIPSRNLYNGSVVLGVAYKDIHELFITNHSVTNTTNKTRELMINTIIMSAVIYPSPSQLLENITLGFENIKEAGQNIRKCVFWNFSEDNPEGWSSQGCETKIKTDTQTECVCNHLTHFAVLMGMDYPEPDESPTSEEDEKMLTIFTKVGMALSLTGVVLTIISYLLLADRHAPLSHIRVSLTACIGAGHIIFFAGIDETKSKWACVTVAALMQYVLMAAFCWMLVEGIYIYVFVVKVFNIVDKIRVYHLMSWGFPAVIVGITLSIAAGRDQGIQSFVDDKYCWLSTANNLIWIFVSFVGLIELVNVFILVRVIREMTTMQHVRDNQSEQIRLGFKACVVLVPLLGVSWLFGFLLPLHIAFKYIFVILNSTQGFFVFLFHCLGNSEIRERFKRKLRGALFNRSAPDKRMSQIAESCDVPLRDDDVHPPGLYELQE